MFVDDVDAIGEAQAALFVSGPRRTGADAKPDPDRDGRLNGGVIVLAATNRAAAGWGGISSREKQAPQMVEEAPTRFRVGRG